MVEREWLRPEEAAQTLGLSRSLTYRLLAEGIIPSVRINRTLRVPVQALHEWTASMVANQVPAATDAVPRRTRAEEA